MADKAVAGKKGKRVVPKQRDTSSAQNPQTEPDTAASTRYRNRRKENPQLAATQPQKKARARSARVSSARVSSATVDSAQSSKPGDQEPASTPSTSSRRQTRRDLAKVESPPRRVTRSASKERPLVEISLLPRSRKRRRTQSKSGSSLTTDTASETTQEINNLPGTSRKLKKRASSQPSPCRGKRAVNRGKGVSKGASCSTSVEAPLQPSSSRSDTSLPSKRAQPSAKPEPASADQPEDQTSKKEKKKRESREKRGQTGSASLERAPDRSPKRTRSKTRVADNQPCTSTSSDHNLTSSTNAKPRGKSSLKELRRKRSAKFSSSSETLSKRRRLDRMADGGQDERQPPLQQAESNLVLVDEPGPSGSGNQSAPVGAGLAAGLDQAHAPLNPFGLGGAAASGLPFPDMLEVDLEQDMGRLQALLEQRGLPSSLFSTLGPRMHQLLQRSLSGGTVVKAQQLLQSMEDPDESTQMSAVIELCQLLVMGNEDTLAGFPIKVGVTALSRLLQKEHNFELMTHSCRALTYMMEALPRSTGVVVEVTPALISKLQVIECMDVAEQAIQALELLSAKHGKQILQQGGVSACLMHIDFFSLTAQRGALKVATNCSQHMQADDFQHMRAHLALMSDRLTIHDKKCLDHVCNLFCNLIDNYHGDERILKEIAAHGLLTNIQQLLMASPPVLPANLFVKVIRMLVVMCTSCPDLAVVLLKLNMADTLCNIMTCPPSMPAAAQTVELVTRSPQEVFELVSLIGELMPRLPIDGIFSVNSLLQKPVSPGQESVVWQWRDDSANWRAYTQVDSSIIETSYNQAEDEVSLTATGRCYTIDFTSMQQINEDTGTARSIMRRMVVTHGGQNQSAGNLVKSDSRADVLQENTELAASCVKTLFVVLYEVYCSSAGPTVRHKCLSALLRMLYYSTADLLKDLLINVSISCQIASMLSSSDLKILVAAVQMSYVLMEKLPGVFSVYFQREGVTHQFHKLSTMETVSPTGSPGKARPTSAPASQAASQPGSPSGSQEDRMDVTDEAQGASGGQEPRGQEPPAQETSSSKLSDALKRKKPPKRSTRKSKSTSDDPEPARASSSKSETTTAGRSSGSRTSLKERISSKLSGNSSSSAQSQSKSNAGSSSSTRDRTSMLFTGKEPKASASRSFLAHLHPSRWGRSSSSAAAGSQATLPPAPPPARCQVLRVPTAVTVSQANLVQPGSKEKVRQWVKDQAIRFIEQYFSGEEVSASSPVTTLNRLCQVAQNIPTDPEAESDADVLREVCSLMQDGDASPFEITHSQLMSRLLTFMTSTHIPTRDHRLRTFLHVFCNFPSPDVLFIHEVHRSNLPLSSLVTKLIACLHHLEQFQVKVHDTPGSNQGSQAGAMALRFFNTHQLKCNLQRHPDCKFVKQWKSGPVKIDPLALIHAVEKYMVNRNILRSAKGGSPEASGGNPGPSGASASFEQVSDTEDPETDSSLSEDDDDDEGADEPNVPPPTIPAGHRLEFLIGDRVLPSNMTMYQAVRLYSAQPGHEDADTDTELPMGHAAIWGQTHTIWYRLAAGDSNQNDTASSPKKTKSDKFIKSGNKFKKDLLWQEGQCPEGVNSLEPYLTSDFPSGVLTADASGQVMHMLRIIYALNMHWTSLYKFVSAGGPLLPQTDFVSSKLTSKANRQLQDPIVFMTGNVPRWLTEVALYCPFLLPFETRQQLFFATAFDRDRAMQRLHDSNDNGASEQAGRITVKLERKKRLVNRKDLLAQAEKVLEETSSTKVLLEISYVDEVGSGLGPTLEFFALVSRELQRADLDIWRSSDTVLGADGETKYLYSPHGLFPAPLGRGAKVSQVTKVRSRFKFLGRLMARAILDSRVLDLPLSPVFYKWFLGQGHSLTAGDLEQIDPVQAKSYRQLGLMLQQKQRIEADASHTAASRELALSALTMDGASIEDLCLDFVLPGYPNVELKKGGKDIDVTLDNLEEYLKLVAHWTLYEGVYRQFEAFREGFDSTFQVVSLASFTPEEMEQVFCGSVQEEWDPRYLSEVCRPDHGYNLDSKAIKFVFEIMSSYTREERRRFTQFITGSPRLPVGGLRSLNPPLTIVRRTFEQESDDDPDKVLPSVMTCVNYLKLPDYTSIDIMRHRLDQAATEGGQTFLLS